MSRSYEDLRNLSRAELIARYNREARRTAVGTRHYLEELRHREVISFLSGRLGQIDDLLGAVETRLVAVESEVHANYELVQPDNKARDEIYGRQPRGTP